MEDHPSTGMSSSVGCDHDILKIGNVTQIHGLGIERKQVVCIWAQVWAQSMW